MRNKVTDPIFAGSQISAYDASSVTDTDWHNLSSENFYNTVTGTQLEAGLKFANVGILSSSASTSHIKLRAAVSASDGTSNLDAVIPVRGTFQTDSAALRDGSNVTTIAFKKAVASDIFIIYAGFNKTN